MVPFGLLHFHLSFWIFLFYTRESSIYALVHFDSRWFRSENHTAYRIWCRLHRPKQDPAMSIYPSAHSSHSAHSVFRQDSYVSADQATLAKVRPDRIETDKHHQWWLFCNVMMVFFFFCAGVASLIPLRNPHRTFCSSAYTGWIVIGDSVLSMIIILPSFKVLFIRHQSVCIYLLSCHWNKLLLLSYHHDRPHRRSQFDWEFQWAPWLVLLLLSNSDSKQQTSRDSFEIHLCVGANSPPLPQHNKILGSLSLILSIDLFYACCCPSLFICLLFINSHSIVHCHIYIYICIVLCCLLSLYYDVESDGHNFWLA